jgi:cytochrome c peroxidase
MVSFDGKQEAGTYAEHYVTQVNRLQVAQNQLLKIVRFSKIVSERESLREAIHQARQQLKQLDFWLRYLEPVQYNKVNGPLPVEWENEVFEKFERPYRREGAGLTLAELYLDEASPDADSLAALIQTGIEATTSFSQDSITKQLSKFSTFYLCNRLYLLNLAAIYTTGFECPDTSRIIPELSEMMNAVAEIYARYDESFPGTTISDEYHKRYRAAINFVAAQPKAYSQFDHLHFVRDYINPLFSMNQGMINAYRVYSTSAMDFSLNKKAQSIFSKQLYIGQNSKGIFARVSDPVALTEIDRLGRLLFYDPILSGNNKRSCASCHKSGEYFTDTSRSTPLQFDRQNALLRNTPSLLNANFNHLLMVDGAHISMQGQAKAVMTNPHELGSSEQEILAKVLSCPDYRAGFKRLLKFTPQEPGVTFEHITSALTAYYARFSNFDAPFDSAMNGQLELNPSVTRGFNLFMSKAQCATCHFVPAFNGVKPPYVSSEFEVLGVPDDTSFHRLSADRGRFGVNPAPETDHAFRTVTIRNSDYTKPYMHNGIFKSMKEVIDFYDRGGGAGRGLEVPNQTLSAEPLNLSASEKNDLLQFISSLNEGIIFEDKPRQLPVSTIKQLNTRKVGGIY